MRGRPLRLGAGVEQSAEALACCVMGWSTGAWEVRWIRRAGRPRTGRTGRLEFVAFPRRNRLTSVRLLCRLCASPTRCALTAEHRPFTPRESPMSDKRLNLTFLLFTTIYAVVTLVISSFIVAGIQRESAGLSGRIAAIQRELEANQVAFDKSRGDTRDAVLLLSNAMTQTAIAGQPTNTRESLEMVMMAIRTSTASAAGFWGRGIDGLYQLVREAPEVTARAGEVEAVLTAARAGEVDPVAATTVAEFLGNAYLADVERRSASRDELRREQEALAQRESMVKGVALALQFMMILAVFAKDYLKERRKPAAAIVVAAPPPPPPVAVAGAG